MRLFPCSPKIITSGPHNPENKKQFFPDPQNPGGQLAFQMLHIANSAVQVEKPDNMAFQQGLQFLKYQFMMRNGKDNATKVV